MSKVAVIVKLVAKPGQRDEVVKAMGSLVGPAGDEPGTEIYALHEDGGNPDAIWFYELYADNDAFRSHSKSPALANAFGQISDSLAEQPEINVVNPVMAKGLGL